MSLTEYRRKRDFTVTSEPEGQRVRKAEKGRRFVIQQHAASRLHFDFRLELARTLVSWAVPKGLPLRHGEKRLAVKVEDHPLSYLEFEGTIPKGQYGGGTVQVWDRGTFEPLSRQPHKDLKGGKLHFVLHGAKLTGEWYLVRLREENQWLLVRGGPDHRRLTKREVETSALSGRTLAEIARNTPAPQKTKTSGPATKLSQSLRVTDSSFVEPMQARLVAEPPPGAWLYEVKFDGYRCLADKKGSGVSLWSRTQQDLTSHFPEIAAAIASLRARQAVVDGEVVALDAQGHPSFQLLQAAAQADERAPLYYYVFDLLSLNGKSLLGWPLEKRREKLHSLLPVADEGLRFSASLGSDASALLSLAATHQLEGLIGKRAGSVYEPGRRSGAWIKLKLVREQELVIGGYTAPSGTRRYLGALLLGYYDKGALCYAGKVGTGFSAAGLRELHERCAPLRQMRCPFVDLPETAAGRYGQDITVAMMSRCHWLRPELVAQIKFTEWTREGRLRQPVFLGLRDDKPARAVRREVPA